MAANESQTLPKGWRRVRAEEVALQQKGAIVSGPFGSNIGKRFFVESGVPVIRGSSLTLGVKEFVDSGFVFLTEEKANEFRGCQALRGDLIFTAAGTLGQVGRIPDKARFPRYIISNKQLRLRCDPAIADSKYLYCWFSSPAIRTHIANHNTGASVPLITLTTLRNLPVNLPPLPVQRRIAGILSAYDELMENSQRRIRILEAMPRTLYHEWFVEFRFPGNEKLPRVASSLGDIPQGWEVKRLDDVLVLQRGFDLPKTYRVEGAVPIYAATGVTGFHNEAKVKAPGVVTGRSGTIGDVLYVQEDFWPLNTALWAKAFPKTEPLYAYYVLSSLDLKQFNSGAAVPTLNRNDIHGLDALIPPRPLQKRFQEIAGAMLVQARTLELQIANVRRARDLLLPRLLSGQVNLSEN